jgi:hypothetical protein
MIHMYGSITMKSLYNLYVVIKRIYLNAHIYNSLKEILNKYDRLDVFIYTKNN